ncbi:hypothetical protein TNCV_3555871 [Trichonephila clavipes]|nr:hypothetical protein TNCV_3555871 [Trichonephila clavipes]
MDLVIFNHGQLTKTTPELTSLSPNFHTPLQLEDFESRQIQALRDREKEKYPGEKSPNAFTITHLGQRSRDTGSVVDRK